MSHSLGHPVGYRIGHRGRGRHRPFRPAGILLVILVAMIALGGPEATILALVLGVPLLSVLLTVGGVVTVGLMVRSGHQWRWPQERLVAPEPAVVPVPAPRRAPGAASGPKARWRAARERFDSLRGEYAAYECDPLAVLRLPALADVTVPATARFVDAFAEAQALDSEKPPPAEHLASFERAVDRAWRAWRAARDAAERIRLAGLSPEERSMVARVVKLLTMAESSGHDAERLAAYAKARDELAKLERAGNLHLPRPAAAALDDAARGRLPA
jgi:hypothetical protein